MIIPALAEEMKTASQKHNFYSLLPSLGPKSILVLKQEARDLVAKKNLNKADGNNIRRLGDVTGCREDAGELLSRVREGLERVVAATRGLPVRSVYYDVWADPPITVGRGSYLDSLLTLAGGRNIFTDLAAPSPQVSLESIAVRDPDLILWPVSNEVGESDPAPADRPGWATISAVRRGDVRTVDSDLVHRLGPRIVEAAAVIAAALHPEAGARLAAEARSAADAGPAATAGQNSSSRQAHGCLP